MIEQVPAVPCNEPDSLGCHTDNAGCVCRIESLYEHVVDIEFEHVFSDQKSKRVIDVRENRLILIGHSAFPIRTPASITNARPSAWSNPASLTPETESQKIQSGINAQSVQEAGGVLRRHLAAIRHEYVH